MDGSAHFAGPRSRWPAPSLDPLQGSRMRLHRQVGWSRTPAGLAGKGVYLHIDWTPVRGCENMGFRSFELKEGEIARSFSIGFQVIPSRLADRCSNEGQSAGFLHDCWVVETYNIDEVFRG